MPLPKIDYPTFVIEIPSTKKKSVFRPFLVREEKLLLMAKTSDNENDMLLAIKQIINNCAVDPDFNSDELAIFDMEYLFLIIRANSVSNAVDVSYRDFEDDKIYEFQIDLNEVKVEFPEGVSNIVKINDTAGLTLKYPKADLFEDQDFVTSGDDSFFQLILRCIDKIYDGDEIYESKNYSIKELESFVDDLDVKVFEQVKTFMANQPSLSYTIKYKNSLGNDKEILLRSITDFFTLR